MQRRRCHEKDRVEPRVREHSRVVVKSVRNAERLARPRELVSNRAAGGDEIGAGDLTGEHPRVPAAETTQAGDAHFQFPLIHDHPFA
jgi:hypothetical protein